MEGVTDGRDCIMGKAELHAFNTQGRGVHFGRNNHLEQFLAARTNGTGRRECYVGDHFTL